MGMIVTMGLILIAVGAAGWGARGCLV